MTQPLARWLRSRVQTGWTYPASSVTIYAVGDVHGRADCLRRAQAAIDRDRLNVPRGERTVEIYVGDYVDRGPASPAVIDNLIARTKQAELIALRGNHEILMTSFLAGALPFEQWRPFGGVETVMAYGVSAQRLQRPAPLAASELAPLVPPGHLEFLRGLQPYAVLEPYCFVHAGLRPGVPLARQTEKDLAWIRDDFLSYRGPFEHIVVHGHTPVRDVEFCRYRIDIDTGAYVSNKLSVLRIDATGPAALEIP